MPVDILNEFCDWSHRDVNKLNPPEACWESYSSLQGNNHVLLSHDVTLSSPLVLAVKRKKEHFYVVSQIDNMICLAINIVI